MSGCKIVRACLCMTALVVVCILTTGTAALALTENMQVPKRWGGGIVAAKTADDAGELFPTAQTAKRQDLMVIPRGRLIVGSGTVDPRMYLQRRGALGSSYTIRAGEPAIVEYTYPRQGFFSAGWPLLRLYDIGILPDLAKAQAAAMHYLDRPLTILQPARNFPSPTVSLPLVTEPPQLVQPPAESAAKPPAPPSQGGLSRQKHDTTFRVERKPGPDLTKPQAAVDAAEQKAAELAAKLAQLPEMESRKAALEVELAAAHSKLQQASEDLDAREKLFEDGVLAKKALLLAREKCQRLEAEAADLSRERDGLASRMAGLREEQGSVQAELDAARAVLAEAEAEAAKAAQKPPTERRFERKLPGGPNTAAKPQVKPHQPEPQFPNPTVAGSLQRHSRALELMENMRQLAARERQTRREPFPPVPQALTRLGDPRWETVKAPTGGVVVEQLVPEGETVAEGQKLLTVANTQWARVYADLSPEYLGSYRQGSPVAIVFDDYPDARFAGWINSLTPTEDGAAWRAEIYAVCIEGYYGADAYATLRWLAGAAALGAEEEDCQLQPVTDTVAELDTGPHSVYAMMPIAPPEYGPALATAELMVEGEFVGHMRVAQLEPTVPSPQASENAEGRLERLKQWRKSFTEGMTTAMFGEQLVLTYPASGQIKRAVEKMGTGRVTHVKNRCARTMAEALGWGLGDAADWADGLPRKGYQLRQDGLPRPGDILVWPFTYGPRGTQHIGVAVLQGGKLMMLSNLAGRLGTSEILPGYLAYHKPRPPTEDMTAKKN